MAFRLIACVLQSTATAVLDEAFGRVNHKGHPDEAETNQPIWCERFAEEQDTNQKLDGGGDVLQDADDVERDFPRCLTKHEQRNGRCHAGEPQ